MYKPASYKPASTELSLVTARQSPPITYSRVERLLYLAVLVILLGAGYSATLLPGIGYSGDAMKFQYIGKVLGIAHAPGYPLYTVLNHLFVTYFPFGSTAYKVNLLSAIYAVGACVMLFKLLGLLGVRPVVALVSALAFGFGKVFWSQAVVAEVYTLLVLFMAAVSYFLVKWHLERRDRDFSLSTALYALSFGNHLLAITLLPAFVYLVVTTDKRVFIQPRKVLWVVGVVTMGALQYGYLWWRLYSPQTPYIEGFNSHNFFYFVTGGSFKPLIFAFTPGEVLTEQIPKFLSFMQSNMPVLSTVGLIGALTGVVARPVRVFLCIYFLTNAFYAVNYDIPDIGGYFLANDLVTAVFIGATLERHVRWRLDRRQGWIVGVLCLLPVIYFGARYPSVNQSDATLRRDAIETVLEVVGEDAVLLPTDYATRQGVLYYLLGEGRHEANNLYEANFGANKTRLWSYLHGEGALRRFAHQDIPASLPLYVYPCDKERIAADLGLVARQASSRTPRLCRLELYERTALEYLAY